ncbi:MAG: colanic acid biosynthesis glycosyltransferase WcaL [Rhodovulum sulfidophilum]|uniref:Colanic acid biosynthesis glycosyltransferase WcaL n=1 Tax=Rhodovulum sulfidophilum TaxID=35806 RepID=A0A2W5QD56_RHOSU|nr:MAG: colanic acid biosynthesis glycosyltransferase WcaL [Rhodovulum sulfidophilum]
MRVAYLINTYPKPSQSFIRREIQALERQGVEIRRFALRDDRAALVDPGDIAEHGRTDYILARGPARLIATLLAEGARAPARGIAALAGALRLGRRADRAYARHLVYLAEAACLARRCRAEGIAHVHAHFGTNSATVAMLAARLGGLSFSFTAHGPEEFDRPDTLALGPKIAASAFTVAVSAFGAAQLRRWVPAAAWGGIRVVHCGVEPGLFAAPAPLPAGPIRLVSVGRLVEQKGQILLVEALAEAARSADIHLTLVGDGELRGAIEAAVAARGLGARVAITGWVDEARVRAELAAAHALVMPSFAEGLPMVVMEAMAAARPVISTYVAGIPELVRPGETGWLVPAGDAAALADAMVALARTPRETLAAMGAAGRARVLERHDIDREAAKLAKHFAAVARVGTASRNAPLGAGNALDAR